MDRLLIDRRSFLGMAAMATAAATTVGFAPAVLAASAPEILPLWLDAPPGSGRPSGPEETNAKGALRNISEPRLVVYRPAQPTGTAIVVVAGGGYARVEAGHESGPACRWLQSRGITAFELIYRLPGDGWQPAAPFQDGQRAMRLVRSRAEAEGFSRIGMLGFSAGAHLSGMTAVRPNAHLAQPVDDKDALSARPDFVGLIYPVLSMMPPFDRTHSRREIVGERPSRAESEAWSVERLVDADTPPIFLAQSADDEIAPIDNSLMMFTALRNAGIPTALHVFPTGRHGWAMGRAGTETAAWPGLFEDWLRDGAKG